MHFINYCCQKRRSFIDNVNTHLDAPNTELQCRTDTD